MKEIEKRVNDTVSRAMLKFFPYRWPLHEFQKQKERVDRLYAPLMNGARSKEDREKLQELMSEHAMEVDLINHEIDLFLSNYLVTEAKKLIIYVPDFRDEVIWKKTGDGIRYILTEKGIATLRAAIRQERKERREAYVTWISLLTGLLAAMTGLFAALLK